MGNGAANNYQSSSGVQGGCRSEPPRPKPYYPAPSTVAPSDSISNQGVETAPTKKTRPNYDYGTTKRPQDRFSKPSAPKPATASRQTPRASHQTPESDISFEPQHTLDDYPDIPSYWSPDVQPSFSGNSQTSFRTPSTSTYKAPSSSRSIPPGSNERAAPSQYSQYAATTAANSQYPPSSSRSNASGNVRGSAAPSTARVTNQQPSQISQSMTSRMAPESTGGASAISSRHNRTAGQSSGQPQQSAGSQGSNGISIGVPPAAQMHFHYNQVDNRQVHINNVSINLLD